MADDIIFRMKKDSLLTVSGEEEYSTPGARMYRSFLKTNK